MEHSEIATKIQDLKAAATSQTEFAHGLLLFVMAHCQLLDTVIENHLDDEIKESVVSYRQALPEYLMALAEEIAKIHPNDNRLD